MKIGGSPVPMRFLYGTPEYVESEVNATWSEYSVLSSGFVVVGHELKATAILVSNSEVRKAQLAAAMVAGRPPRMG